MTYREFVEAVLGRQLSDHEWAAYRTPRAISCWPRHGRTALSAIKIDGES